MSLIDRLLQIDLDKVKEGLKKKYEVNRLSELVGEPFILEIAPLTPEQTNHIAEISKNFMETKVTTILEAVRLEGNSLNNQALLDKFNCLTGKEVVQKLFLAGEITTLYDVIAKISGYGEDVVKEVKNS